MDFRLSGNNGNIVGKALDTMCILNKRLHVTILIGTCRAFDGSVVSEGEQFQPNSDPCHQCHCISGEERNCRTISCDPPKDCPNHRAVPGLCCAFTCEERVVDPDFIRKDRKGKSKHLECMFGGASDTVRCVYIIFQAIRGHPLKIVFYTLQDFV